MQVNNMREAYQILGIINHYDIIMKLNLVQNDYFKYIIPIFSFFFIAFSVVLLSNAMPLNDRIEDFDLLTNIDYYDQL